MAQDLEMDDIREAKNRLKAYTDDNGYEKPVYETVSKRIEEITSKKVYKVRVIIEGLVDTTGEGLSRRIAEYRAAINAMNEIQEVREEQKKSKVEQQLAQNQRNGVTNGDSDIQNDQVHNDSTGGTPVANEDSVQQLNGDHNSDNQSVNDVNHNNSIIISADINSSADNAPGDNHVLVNGHNSDDQSDNSSGGGAQNDIEELNGDISPQNGQNNEKTSQMNGKEKFWNSTTARTFASIHKSSVQTLHDFCMEKQSPYPFYDTTYRDGTFLIKCRIEFNENEEKREFFGTGTGLTSKEAKLVAADDIVQQLAALSLLNTSNDDNSPQNGQNNGETSHMNGIKINLVDTKDKNSIQRLHEFCMEKESPYPFYETSYSNKTFLVNCRIEFNENEEKREFFGTGTGLTSKEAKLVASEDVVQQLTALSLI